MEVVEEGVEFEGRVAREQGRRGGGVKREWPQVVKM